MWLCCSVCSFFALFLLLSVTLLSLSCTYMYLVRTALSCTVRTQYMYNVHVHTQGHRALLDQGFVLVLSSTVKYNLEKESGKGL